MASPVAFKYLEEKKGCKPNISESDAEKNFVDLCAKVFKDFKAYYGGNYYLKVLAVPYF